MDPRLRGDDKGGGRDDPPSPRLWRASKKDMVSIVITILWPDPSTSLPPSLKLRRDKSLRSG